MAPDQPTERASLRGAAVAADADRFVGRAAEMAVVERLLGDGAPSRVLFVHGPGGIGKSTLLRAISRRAVALGFDIVALDPRAPAGAFDAEVERLGETCPGRVLVVVDEVDALGSRLVDVRERLLDALPASARLVLAGRAGPDSTWRADGLDAIVEDLPLGPLDDTDAHDLLERRGVDDGRRPEIVAWAQGSPLALTVASSGPGTVGGVVGAEELEAKLTSWLAGQAMLDVPTELVEVAALAPAVDARLLAAALPARATRDGMRQLAALPVVEQVGGRIVLHSVLAAAVRARMEATAPQRRRVVTRRIVEHLAGRARLGDIQSLIELSQFISDPRLRQVVSNQPSPSLFPSRPHPGELEAFARDQGFDRGEDWPELTEWFDGATDYALCIRRRDGSIVLYAAFEAVRDLDEIGPITASLRLTSLATEVDPRRSFAGVVLFADADEHERIEAARLGSGALMHRHGVPDMHAVLIHYPAPDRRPSEAISAIASQLPGDLPRAVALSDFRPAGAVGFVEQIVLAELGVASHDVDASALLAIDDDPVRQEQLRQRLDEVFGDSPADRRMRTAIELVHLSPRHGEQACLDTLHVSRSTWFRLLRQAREHVLATPHPPPR